MSWISVTVVGMSVLSSTCVCHWLVAALNRSLTLRSEFWGGGGCGSHLWSSIFMLLPSPTFHTVVAQINSLASNKLYHTNDGLCPKAASINEQLGKYRALYTLKKSDWVSWFSLHACLASIARLNAWMSLNPIPSFSFDLHNFSHFIEWIFFSFLVWSHQYLASMEFMSSQIFFEILNMLME